jgi:hypothetical protein
MFLYGLQRSVLSDAKFKSYKAMDSYTLSGFMEIFSRNTAFTIEPKYSEDEILEALNFANGIGLFSALEISHLAGSKQLAESFLEKLEKSA